MRVLVAAAVAVGVLGVVPPATASSTDVQLLSSRARATPVAVPHAPKIRKAPKFTGRGYTIGDSVMLGARDALTALNYTVDAKGSRFPFQGYDVLRAALPRLPSVVVVHMGTNGGITQQWFDAYMRLLGPNRTVVWVTLQLRNDYSRYTYEDRSNLVIREGVKRWKNTRLVDWNRISESHKSDWLIFDGIHLTFAGRVAYAKLINAAVRA